MAGSRSDKRLEKERGIVWRVAVYVRLSREDAGRAAAESESVGNQKMILKQFLDRRFEGLYELVDYYIDDGLTGTDDTRGDFMRMIQDMEKGRVNCMLCKTLSRAFRNYADQGYYLEQYFPLKGIRFISTGDPYVDTYINPDAVSGLEVPISGLMNDRYAGRTSSDVRRTFHAKRQNGQFIGAFPPYGYLKDPSDKNHLILDEETALIKRDILSWLLYDGMSLAGCAKKLNEMGIPNPTAYKRQKGWNYVNPMAKANDGLWCGTTVRRMMLDKVNLGHMVQGKQRVISYKVHNKVSVPQDEWYEVEGTHEPTFTREEYDKLAKYLHRSTRTADHCENVHLFSGFLRCADCHKAMQRSVSKGVVYYCCRTNREKSSASCSRHSIREDRLEKAVLAAISAQVNLLDSVAELVQAAAAAPVQAQALRAEKLLRDKNDERERIKAISDSLYEDWKTGDITRAEYQRMKAKYREQEQRLAAAAAKLEDERRRLSMSAQPQGGPFHAFLTHRNLQRLDRAILTELVDTILVHEDKRITIQFTFQDELARVARLTQGE